jgi:hypothetical protein
MIGDKLPLTEFVIPKKSKKKTTGDGRKLHNEERHHSYSLQNIIKVIK